MNKALRLQRGMTLLETVLASTIFALVIATTFGLMHFTTRSFDQQIALTNLQTRGEDALRKMVELVEDGTQVRTTPHDSTDPADLSRTGYNRFYDSKVIFRVAIANPQAENLPVETKMLTDKFTFPGDVELKIRYGWRDDDRYIIDSVTGRMLKAQGPGIPTSSSLDGVTIADTKLDNGQTINNSTPDGQMVIEFVLNTNAPIGQNGIFDEAVEQIDIDGDDELSTQYAVGFIEVHYEVQNVRGGKFEIVETSRKSLADSNVLQPMRSIPAANPATEDTLTESSRLKTTRIFTQKGSQLVINLWLLTVHENSRTPHIVKCSSLNFLRNDTN